MITPNMNKSLSDIFDVELTTTDKSVEELKISAKVDNIDSLEKQRDYVKANIISLIEKGMTALDSMTTIANSTEAGKDFDVVTKMIQTLVDTNMTLLESEVIHKPVNNPVLNNGNVGQITNNTAVFVGSTSELSKYLKENSNTAIDV
jgi:hypothetical protein